MYTNTVWWHRPNQVRTVSFERLEFDIKLVLIHSIGELDLMNELYEMAIYVDNIKK